MADLDRIDYAVVAALTEDARMSVTALAERVGFQDALRRRLRRLEAAGIIRGYGRCSTSAGSLGHVAFVQVHLHYTKSAALDAFDAAVRALPEVDECHLIAGSFDYLVKVRTSAACSTRGSARCRTCPTCRASSRSRH